MPDSSAWLVERLKTEGQKTLDYFQALPDADCQIKIYTEGSHWTAHHILVHFVSAEIALGKLIDDIAEGGKGASPEFDINRFNESQVARMGSQTKADLLRQFTEARSSNAIRVSRLLPSDLERIGRHPYLGEASLEEIIKLIYRHNQIHQRDIRKTLSELSQRMFNE